MHISYEYVGVIRYIQEKTRKLHFVVGAYCELNR